LIETAARGVCINIYAGALTARTISTARLNRPFSPPRASAARSAGPGAGTRGEGEPSMK
jgi:hypothetical protein